MSNISEYLKQIVALKENVHRIKFASASEKKAEDVNVIRHAKKETAKLRRLIKEIIKGNKK